MIKEPNNLIRKVAHLAKPKQKRSSQMLFSLDEYVHAKK